MAELIQEEYVREVNTAHLATSAGMGSKEAHKEIKRINKTQKRKQQSKSEGITASVPLQDALEVMKKIDGQQRP